MAADNEKLIELIKVRPQIYNFHLRDHSDKHTLEQLWSEVAQAMNWSVNDCKKQWGVCRNSYARCLRLINEPTSNSKKRKIWYLYDAMQFLQDYMHLKKGSKVRRVKPSTDDEAEQSSKRRKLPEIDLDSSDDVVLEIKSEGLDLSATVEQFLTNNLDKSETSNDNEQLVTATQLPCAEATTTTTTTAEVMSNDHILELSLPQTMRKEIDEFEDPNMLFFKSLLPDLEKLSEQRQRLFRRNTFLCLHNLIDEEESGSQRNHDYKNILS